MTWEYLHLIAHSFPIVLSITAVGVGVTGWILQRPDLERWALVALLVAGVFVIPAYITGLYAADVVADRVFVGADPHRHHGRSCGIRPLRA